MGMNWGLFPGAQPYDERWHRMFMGRDAAIAPLQQFLQLRGLALLWGDSGVGKTSFLQTGLMWDLWYQRSLAKEQDKAQLAAALLIRDWVGIESGSMLAEAIRRSVAGLSDVAKRYAEVDTNVSAEVASVAQRWQKALAALPANATSNEIVGVLEGSASTLRGKPAPGRIFVILDQLEEVTEQNPEGLAAISEFVGDMHYKFFHSQGPSFSGPAGSPVILLSMRPEGIREVQSAIGQYVADFARFYVRELPPLDNPREVFRKSAEAGGMILEQKVLDNIFAWADAAFRASSTSFATSKNSDSSGEQRVEVLKLNAFMREIDEFTQSVQDGAAGNDSGEGADPRGHPALPVGTERPRIVTMKLLESFVRERGDRHLPSPPIVSDGMDPSLHRHELGRDFQEAGAELVRSVLQRYLDFAVLPLPERVTKTGSADLLGESEWEKLARRVATARMAQHLSSAGRKLRRPLDELVSSAWDDGLRLQHGEAAGYGIEWSKEQLDRELRDLTERTLTHLASKNILRPKETARGTTYELIHDGWSAVLIDWARQQRASPIDAIVQPFTATGRKFYWDRLTGLVSGAKWRDCWIGPHELDARSAGSAHEVRGPRLRIEGVKFVKCKFNSSLFSCCDFKDVTFSETDLSSVSFIDCTFSGVTFSKINSGGFAWIRGVISGCEFIHCELNGIGFFDTGFEGDSTKFSEHTTLRQFTTNDCTGDAAVEFDHCRIDLSDFRGFAGPEDAPRPQGGNVLLRDCQLLHCLVPREILSKREGGPEPVGAPVEDLPPWVKEDVPRGAR